MNSLIRILLFLALFSMAAVVPVFSQASGSTAELRGQVTDSNGAVVPGATVTLTDVDKGTSRTATTDESGQYIFLAVPPSGYQLKVEAAASNFAASSTNI